MLKQLLTIIYLFISFACFSQQADTVFTDYLHTITASDLKKHLEIVASDKYEGRATGEKGQKMAADYISAYFKKINVGTFNEKSYLQEFVLRKDSLAERKKKKVSGDLNTENIIGIIEGDKFKDECIVISAHYDHLGKEMNGDSAMIFNGADDDGSGTVALLEIAEAFMKAKKEGHGPQRTVIIAAFTAEELGLWGSKYYVENPFMPLENTVANFNIDMIGRVDEKHKETSDYVYLIGANRISSELELINEQANKTYTNLVLDYAYDSTDVNRYYYRSDHYNFAKHDVPVVFYFNGTHEDYHKETDEVEKINFELLEKRTQLIFAAAWELANREKRIVKDKLKK